MRIPKIKDFRHLEEVVNKYLGLSGTKGSGNVAGDGDGKGRDKGLVSTYSQLLAECKYTEKKKGSVSIKKTDFWKTEAAACRLGRIPAMFTSDADGEAYVIIKLGDFSDIYRSHIEKEKGQNYE